MNGVVLITGISAAGKSTVAQALAERLPRSAHVRGDTFRRMVVGGRAEMTPEPSDEAMRQLHLRYRIAANAADL
ncbi:AAA family ATPase [Nonomuraea sp. M3C6]|uniref:AAA family ATPase n=1 Tax=Nonomuraea marmarensis TaxID=3351344 RepID=A0ABW7AR82_9ACTN